MCQEAREMERWFALIRQGAPDCQAVASNRGCFLILARHHTPLDLTHASRILFEFGLGMVIGLSDGFGSFFEIVELTQLVRDVGQDLLNCQADRTLGIRHHAVDWHRQGTLDLAQQVGQVVLSSAIEAASKQDLAREGVAQDPQHILGFEWLETVDGEDNVALLLEGVFEPGLISEVEGE
jgi:hypothetical protein